MKSLRKVYLINRGFQLPFIGFTVVMGFLTTAIFYCANLLFFARFIKAGHTAGLPENHPFFQFILQQERYMNAVFAVTAVVSLIILFVGNLMLSHRVAGPLYRLHKHLLKVAQTRQLEDVRFREGDFFTELADAFNGFVKALREGK